MNAKVQQSIEEWTTSKKLTGVSVCSQHSKHGENKPKHACLQAGGGRGKYIATRVDVPISITTIRPNLNTRRNGDDRPTYQSEGGHCGSISQTYRPVDNHNSKRAAAMTHLLTMTTRADEHPRANSNSDETTTHNSCDPRRRLT